MSAERPLLLILRALGLGDLLTCFPALRALRRSYPNHQLVLATPRYLGPLAQMSKAVDACEHASGLVALPVDMSRADVAVNLHGRGPQSHRLLLDTQPRRLIAFANIDARHSAGPQFSKDEHEVNRWCRLVEDAGSPADPGQLDLDPVALVSAMRELPPGLRTDDETTVIHPGSAQQTKHWPIGHYAAVARHERARRRRVVITGSEHEIALAEQLAECSGLPPDSVLAGRTTPVQLAAVIAGANRLISADTGAAHLATATRTPSVVIFGPVSPAHWGPPPDRPWHRALYAKNAEGVGDPAAVSSAEVIGALTDLPPPPPRPFA